MVYLPMTIQIGNCTGSRQPATFCQPLKWNIVRTTLIVLWVIEDTREAHRQNCFVVPPFLVHRNRAELFFFKAHTHQ